MGAIVRRVRARAQDDAIVLAPPSTLPSVTATDEIRNLLGTYCELMDQGDFNALGALFTNGQLADEAGTAIAVGAPAVADLYHVGTMLYDGSPRTKHVVANTVIDWEEDASTAVARSSYVVFQQTDDLPLQAIISGRYHDTFEHHDGAWRFAERRFSIDLLGDLSHHLRYELS